jgi:hypothetical protein
VKGPVTLAGNVKIEYDPHGRFVVMGPVLDLSGLREFKLRLTGGGITLARTEGVQTLTPPPAGVCAPEITKSEGGTLRLAGAVDTWALFVDPESTLDLNYDDSKDRACRVACFTCGYKGAILKGAFRAVRGGPRKEA